MCFILLPSVSKSRLTQTTAETPIYPQRRPTHSEKGDCVTPHFHILQGDTQRLFELMTNLMIILLFKGQDRQFNYINYKGLDGRVQKPWFMDHQK